MYAFLVVLIEWSDDLIVDHFRVFEVVPVEDGQGSEVHHAQERPASHIGLPLDHKLQKVDEDVVEGEHDPKLEDGLDAGVVVGHQVLEGEEDGYVEDEQLAE